MRPDVILFGEMLPMEATVLLQAQLSRGFDAVVSIGTTGAFPYITGPLEAAIRNNIPTIEINPGDTTTSGIVDLHLKMKAAEALDKIWKRFKD